MDIIVREYIKVVWQKKGFFLLALIALASATSLDYYTPMFYKEIANNLAQPYSDETLASLMHSLSMIGIFYAGIWLSWRCLEVAIIPLDGGGVNLLEKRCFAILQKQHFVFFENRFSGSLIKQANRFSRSFEIIMDWFLFQFYQNVLGITIAFILFYQAQPEFAIYFLIWVLLFISWSVGFSIWKLRFDKAVASADSVVGGKYSDAISNIFIVKSFALEQHEQAGVDKAADHVYRKKIIAWCLMFLSFAVQGIMTFSMELLLIYLMIQKWKDGQFEVGEFVLFQSLLLLLIHRLWDFGRNFRNFFTALADASEMAEIIRQDDIETDSPHAKQHTIERGEILFDHVSFNYAGNASEHTKLFEHFSLTINAGEKIALVGHSGSGKTSLTKLLFRFIEPDKGSIYFDGIAANNFTLQSLRKQISLVPQQPELFHRSVLDNISLGQSIEQDMINLAAKNARCLDFIQNLPDQFETLVGERGVKLSGGEKQRIAIARAFLEDAPIVVLDEATSALDSITEKEIQTAIFDLIKDKTAIIIAHRLSTILKMDRILVLEDGKIIEQGTHQELINLNGQYAEMWKHQSGGFLVDE